MMKILALSVFALFAAVGAASGADVVIVPCDKGYYTSLARHVSRWLSSEGIVSAIADAEKPGKALDGAKVAFLVGFADDGPLKTAAVESFLSRGGKAVVFYSSSMRLASLMGVRLLGYRAASRPGEWSRMDFSGESPVKPPSKILQTSTVLQRAAPMPGKGRVMATWSDRKGKPTGDAAWIETGKGFWMTHVMLADGDETLKARFLASLVGWAAPALWQRERSIAKATAKHRKTRAFAKRQIPKKGEIHAVWEHSGAGLYPGDWPRTIKLLRENRVTDIFVNVAGAGFAHYDSKTLPHSKLFLQEGDQLEACLAAAKGSGVRVHAWIACFNATRSSPAVLADFKKRGWLLKAKNGETSEYVDPSSPEVRRHVLSAIEELSRKEGLAGIHLDYARWYDHAVKPKAVATVVSKFVAEARRRVKRPMWLTAAVYGKYPACIASVGQDWTGWVDSGAVDYVVPMDYTESNERFEGFLQQHAETRKRASRTIAGIGVTANESRLDAQKTMEQILLSRKYSLAGVALFDLDTTLEKDVFPYLRLGIW